MVDLLNMLCELAIFLAMLTHWTLLPGVVATQRDTQCATEHADRILLSILLNDLVPHNWPCEKMDTVFLAEWQTLPEKLSFESSQVSGRILAKTELLPVSFFTLLQVRT